jgi:hypothetical protein
MRPAHPPAAACPPTTCVIFRCQQRRWRPNSAPQAFASRTSAPPSPLSAPPFAFVAQTIKACSTLGLAARCSEECECFATPPPALRVPALLTSRSARLARRAQTAACHSRRPRHRRSHCRRCPRPSPHRRSRCRRLRRHRSRRHRSCRPSPHRPSRCRRLRRHRSRRHRSCHHRSPYRRSRRRRSHRHRAR